MKTAIEMARKAGLAKYGDGLREGVYPFMESIERFAEIARADEREACAKVCIELPAQLEEFDALNRAAAAIRARGQA